jgi:hypothetical protein
MFRLLARWLARYADAAARQRIGELEQQLSQEKARVRILEAERETMALVMARDRARVQAEVTIQARRAAHHAR